MTRPSWPLQRECSRFYGDPRGANGRASAKWESANLTLVKCPWVLRYDGRPVKGINVHRKVAESLARVLAAIWGRVDRSQAEIDRIGMSIYGGAYNFRLMRGGSSLSMHSWGCAIDFDPDRNGFGDRTPAMDRRVIEEFEREGWEWGGHWSKPDGMHFQAAWSRANPPRLKSAAVSLLTAPDENEPEPEPEAAPEAGRILSVKTRLKVMGYHEVGIMEGPEASKWGGRTAAAIAAFKNDRHLAGAAEIDDALVAEIDRAEAEGWTRPIAKERAEAKPDDVAKNVESVGASRMSKLWAWVLGIPSAATAFVKGIADHFEEATQSPILNAAKAFVADNTLGLALLALGIAAAIWWASNRAETSAVTAYQEGRIT